MFFTKIYYIIPIFRYILNNNHFKKTTTLSPYAYHKNIFWFFRTFKNDKNTENLKCINNSSYRLPQPTHINIILTVLHSFKKSGSTPSGMLPISAVLQRFPFISLSFR